MIFLSFKTEDRHVYYFFLGLITIIITYKLIFIVIHNAFLLISEEALFQFICAGLFCKLRKGTNTRLIKHRVGAGKFITFQQPFSPFSLQQL